VDETWDVPDDHFIPEIKDYTLSAYCYLNDIEMSFLIDRGVFKIDVDDDKNFPIPSGEYGGFSFQGWNPICIPNIYYINWKIKQGLIWRETCQYPDFEKFQQRKTSSELRREAGEKRRKSGIKEKYGATKCYRDDKHKMRWN